VFASSRLLKNSFLGVSPTSEAKAGVENKLVIAALKRCATQKQGQNRVFQQPARADPFKIQLAHPRTLSRLLLYVLTASACKIKI
jgi:hypothetical protein